MNPYDPNDPFYRLLYGPPQKPAGPPQIDWSALIAPKPASVTLPAITPDMILRYATPPKKKVFVSYRHKGDQWYYDRFSTLFADKYELFTDNSVDREIDSDDSEYQSRKIREDYITGSSITILLCGAETCKRKHVDWEIHATLEKKHALLGIALPTALRTYDKKIRVPDRYYDNWVRGYARWMHWSEKPEVVASEVDQALKQADAKLIDNSRPQMGKNLS